MSEGKQVGYSEFGRRIHQAMIGGISKLALCFIYYICFSYFCQTTLGNGTIILYAQIYIDATHVTVFGTVKYWGLFLWIGNIPKADRRDRGGRGRAILIAYLPVVSHTRVLMLWALLTVVAVPEGRRQKK